MSVKGLASPQLLAHNEAVIFTDHLSQEAYWGREERRRVEGREGRGRKKKKKARKENECVAASQLSRCLCVMYEARISCRSPLPKCSK